MNLEDTLIPDEIWEVVEKAYHKIGPGYSTAGLDEKCRTVILVCAAQGIIEYAGFDHFFRSDLPDQPPYEQIAEAFENIGATEAADAIRMAISVFSIDHPELDFEHRRRTMERLGLCGYSGGFKKLTSTIRDHNVRHITLLAKYIEENDLL